MLTDSMRRGDEHRETLRALSRELELFRARRKWCCQTKRKQVLNLPCAANTDSSLVQA